MTTPTAHIAIHTDSDLLAQTAQGSTEAFTQLFYRYKDSLHRLSWSITGSRTIADDVLQEVFLKIWPKRNDLVNVQNFHGFLVVVTRRVLLNELRRLGRLESLDSHPGRCARVDATRTTMMFTKRDTYRHEREIRLCSRVLKGVHPLDKFFITAIHFGDKTTADNKKQIEKIVRDMNYSLQIHP